MPAGLSACVPWGKGQAEFKHLLRLQRIQLRRHERKQVPLCGIARILSRYSTPSRPLPLTVPLRVARRRRRSRRRCRCNARTHIHDRPNPSPPVVGLSDSDSDMASHSESAKSSPDPVGNHCFHSSQATKAPGISLFLPSVCLPFALCGASPRPAAREQCPMPRIEVTSDDSVESSFHCPLFTC